MIVVVHKTNCNYVIIKHSHFLLLELMKFLCISLHIKSSNRSKVRLFEWMFKYICTSKLFFNCVLWSHDYIWSMGKVVFWLQHPYNPLQRYRIKFPVSLVMNIYYSASQIVIMQANFCYNTMTTYLKLHHIRAATSIS